MAHNVEPMDIDNIESDFDNKENSIHHSNVYPRTPCTEKGYEELDVSELNMKLRYSITPAASPMSKSFTANCNDNRSLESGDDNLNSNLTRSLHSAIPKGDVLTKSVKQLPLQTISSEQFVDSNRNAAVLRPLDTTTVINSDVTVTRSNDADEVLSFPSSSSSTAHTPEATTPTKDIPRNDGSPIMRGLKSVLNMFRSSQSPIPPADNLDGTKQVLSPADVTSTITPDSSTQPASSAVLASTPIAAYKHKESNLSKRSSPLKESLVFNEDLEKELLWKDETTILFNEEKIPIHKLFYQQGTSSMKKTAKKLEGDKLDTDFNSSVEYMDISCNDSMVKNKTVTELQDDSVHANESDTEFVDCETTFTNDKMEAGLVENKNNKTNLTATVTDMVSALNADSLSINTEIVVKAEPSLVESQVPHVITSLETEIKDIPQVKSEPDVTDIEQDILLSTTNTLSDVNEVFKELKNSVNIENEGKIIETNIKSDINIAEFADFDTPNIISDVDIAKKLQPEKETFETKLVDVEFPPSSDFEDTKLPEVSRACCDGSYLTILNTATNTTVVKEIESVPLKLDVDHTNDSFNNEAKVVRKSEMQEHILPANIPLPDDEDLENEKSIGAVLLVDECTEALNINIQNTTSPVSENVDQFENMPTVPAKLTDGNNIINDCVVDQDLTSIHNENKLHQIQPLDDKIESNENISLQISHSPVQEELKPVEIPIYEPMDINDSVSDIQVLDEVKQNTVIIENQQTVDISSEQNKDNAVLLCCQTTLKTDTEVNDDQKAITVINIVDAPHLPEAVDDSYNKETRLVNDLETKTQDNVIVNQIATMPEIMNNESSLKEHVSVDVLQKAFNETTAINDVLQENPPTVIQNVFDLEPDVEPVKSEDTAVKHLKPENIETVGAPIAPPENYLDLLDDPQIQNAIPAQSSLPYIASINKETSLEEDVGNDKVEDFENKEVEIKSVSRPDVEPVKSEDTAVKHLKPENIETVEAPIAPPENSLDLLDDPQIQNAIPAQSSLPHIASINKEISLEEDVGNDKVEDFEYKEVEIKSDSRPDVEPVKSEDTAVKHLKPENIETVGTPIAPPENSLDLLDDPQTQTVIPAQSSLPDIAGINKETGLEEEDVGTDKVDDFENKEVEIIVSENNSPFVSLTGEIQLPELEPDQLNFEELENTPKTKVVLTPPSSPKIVSKGYNFNFDEIDDPFATKTKIRLSPTPDTPERPLKVTDMAPKDEKPHQRDVRNRRKSQPERKKPVMPKKKINSSFSGSVNVPKSKANITPYVVDHPAIEDKDLETQPTHATLSELIPSSPKLSDTTDMKIKQTDLKKLPQESINHELAKEQKSVELRDIDTTTEVNIEENKTSVESLNEISNETKNPSSSEQSIYYSAGTSSGESSKNVFNLPEIDDMNFNPFVTKSKIRQSPPPSLNASTSLNATKEHVPSSNALEPDATFTENPFETKSKMRQSPPPNLIAKSSPNATQDIAISSDTPMKPEALLTENPFLTKSNMRQSPPRGLNSSDTLNITHETGFPKATQKLESDATFTEVHSGDYEFNKDFETKTFDEKEYGNLSNTTCSSKATDEKDLTVREVHTEDEDTIEGPFLEAEELKNYDDKMSDFDSKDVDMMQFSELPPQNAQENNDDGELFIDAEAFEFLLNQNKGNVVTDSGKESLFLKFDPLFAKRMSSDGVLAALNKKRQSTPKKISKAIEMDATFDKSIAGPSAINTTHDVATSSSFAEESTDDFNVTVSKPMMVVTPAVNPIVTPRNKTMTPPSSNRRSITFTSPAIAVIDRLLSLSANNSLVGQDTIVTHMSREQNEADLALTQLRELLAEKEINVYNLRTESKELKDRLSSMESQMRILESESQDRLKKINSLNEKLTEKTRLNKSMAAVVEEYERTIASLIAETEQDKKRNNEERIRLIKERDEQTAHLASMEVSFNDLHSKYEKSKQIILTCKANEDAYKKSIKEFEENLAKMQSNYELLKQHATSKLNHANQELEKMNRSHEAEVLKLNAMIKRKELHITSLEETLAQKTKANEELTAICDELINKVG